ncbi:MAG TPA: hypothetical protein VNZ45_15505 [Bacteroidia bacterium]|jgi:hypothetical protein|nr:hypothetical protein [Bacteroidia bacterium]
MKTLNEIIANRDKSKGYNGKKTFRKKESDLLVKESRLQKIFFFGKISTAEYQRRLKLLKKP